ncbi:hypothetical protein TVAG_078920 [Trichomonas vaginalis G3]|uniref:Uncharacterized protein n=1 Tax=Trichomonas vaginalis (strain ATCC PRA-98 / G3) TaxID=412133 RepID=A2FUF9_TRIV3|nr:hypothetical protein TVAGG3_0720450 [Trichomonas vaginalis G3]EAX91454.1 hypothetical protein TVAG_078920 [Trichomonas vaginalis G3]KAI5510553.1 hypothetical protein TVAGG3_0720450 [Trichomonas vaginalis G3]|eukprot:XP_001304384.1 hypothetical protein [Trichomonas vaginalis G3]
MTNNQDSVIEHIAEQTHTEEPGFVSNQDIIENETNELNNGEELFNTSNSAGTEEEEMHNKHKEEVSNGETEQITEVDTDEINSSTLIQPADSESEKEYVEEPHKMEISPELAAFLEDMPFGLGKDLSSRVRKTDDKSGIRPKLPSARELKAESEKSVENDSKSNSPPKSYPKKKIVQPKPKSALEDALDLFSNPYPFSWQQKPKETSTQSIPKPRKTPLNEGSAKVSSSNIVIDDPIVDPSESSQRMQSQPPKPIKSSKYLSQPQTPQISDNSDDDSKPNSVTRTPPQQTIKQKPNPAPKSDEKVLRKPYQEIDISNYMPSASDNAGSPQKPPKDTVPAANDDTTMTFLTGLTDDQAYRGADNLPTSTSQIPSSHQSKTTRVPKKKRMNYAMMSFLGPPKLPVTKPIDITKYEYKDADFDVEANIDKIPPLLLDLLDYPHESLTFHALCGSLLPNVPSEHVSRVVLELKKVLQKTTSQGLISESCYVENCQEDLKNAHSKKKAEKDPSEYKGRLDKAQTKLDKIHENYEIKMKEIEEEESQAMQYMEDKFQQEAASLDDEWNSEKMQNKYSKPSAKLIDLRNEAKINLKAHRFEDAILIANEISQLEELESGEAGKRMAEAYNNAAKRLQQKYESDKNVLLDTYDAKKRKLKVELEQSERPFLTQMDKLNFQITQIEKEKELEKRKNKREATIKKAQSRNNVSNKQLSNIPPIQVDGKLKLPPLPTMSHNRAKSAIDSSSTK